MRDNPNCYKCKYYTVTWNPRTPKACKYFEFQSVHLPSVVVFNSTGEACKAYTQKQ